MQVCSPVRVILLGCEEHESRTFENIRTQLNALMFDCCVSERPHSPEIVLEWVMYVDRRLSSRREEDHVEEA